MTDEYATDRRVALDPSRMRTREGLHYLPVSTSTQVDAKRMLDEGVKSPMVIVTEEQTQGRGRLDRTWTAPPHSSVLMSIALPIPDNASTLTLMAGVVVAEALIAQGVPVRLKWPNDIVVMQDGRMRKLGGMLAEIHGDAVVVGIGLNIDMSDDQLPTPDAISCRQAGSTPRREMLIDDIIDGLVDLSAAATLARYRELCVTIGALVQVSRIAGEPLSGTAVAVDADGALVVRDAQGVETRVTAGDVHHVRPGGEA